MAMVLSHECHRIGHYAARPGWHVMLLEPRPECRVVLVAPHIRWGCGAPGRRPTELQAQRELVESDKPCEFRRVSQREHHVAYVPEDSVVLGRE